MKQTGNLTSSERTVSAIVGGALTLLSAGRGGPIVRALSATVGAALLARAVAGHCGVKSALNGHTTLADGLADQWRRMRGTANATAHALPGSPAHAVASDAVDESIDESFPASDPPASRIPDEPPSNAEAKWKAARAAGAFRPHP